MTGSISRKLTGSTRKAARQTPRPRRRPRYARRAGRGSCFALHGTRWYGDGVEPLPQDQLRRQRSVEGVQRAAQRRQIRSAVDVGQALHRSHRAVELQLLAQIRRGLRARIAHTRPDVAGATNTITVNRVYSLMNAQNYYQR